MKPWSRLTRLTLLLCALVGCATPLPPTEPQPGSTSPLASDETGSIYPLGNMQTARATHTASLLQSGQVLIAGGFGQGDNHYTNSAELYDPNNRNFTLTGSMAAERCCHTATSLSDGRVLMIGGLNGEYLPTAEIYDPATGGFTPTGSLITPRAGHIAVLLDNGKVLVAGGVGTGWNFLASAELYDPATGSFTHTGDMITARESHTVTKLEDGRILITGGHRGRQAENIIYESAELYDPASGAFTPTGNMSMRRYKHDAVLLADGRVLISGGSDERDDRGAYTGTEIYDPASARFTPAADMPTVRYKFMGTSLLLHDGDVLLAGGARNAALYHPQRNIFQVVAGDLGTATLSRLFSTATLLQDGSVLITGGYGIGQNVSAGAWIYDP